MRRGTVEVHPDEFAQNIRVCVGNSADLQALAAGQAPLNSGTTLSASVTRRGQSPVGSSHSGRRNASVPDTSCLTGVKAGNSSPSDCPVRQQYAERAAELPKIKGVFIGKKHTCWVAQWNDANGNTDEHLRGHFSELPDTASISSAHNCCSPRFRLQWDFGVA